MTSSRADWADQHGGAPGGARDGFLVRAFPRPGQELGAAFSELAEKSLSVQADGLLGVADLPRPWSPAECKTSVRHELWIWLDQVAAWVNREHLWTIGQPGIPSCWPRHPHLVHDLAVLAACRYLAALALTPDSTETWQRVTLPGFLERMYVQLGEGCSSGHATTRPRERRDLEFDQASDTRLDAFEGDAAAELRDADAADH